MTVFDAYQPEKSRHLRNEWFDDYFEKMEGVEVIKQTQPQFNKGTRTLNDNRYLVVTHEGEDGEKIDLGTSIEISGLTFNMQYTGMPRYCYLCERKHGTDCPSKVRFDILKKLRKGLTEKRKIYSDSSHRQTNQLALMTDVACMSGGGIGQLCNAIPYDHQHEEVVIHAGTNEISNTQTLPEFVFTVTKATEKLNKLAEKTKVTLVLPCAPTTGAHEAGKAIYLEEKMKEINSIKIVKLKDIEYDGSRHPSEKGTQQMIEQLQQELGEKIILNGAEKEITTSRKYSLVQPIYKVGCRGCDNLEYTPHLCRKCKIEAETVDFSYLDEIVKNIQAELFPAFPDANEVEMKNISKRNGEFDDGNLKKKNARNESDA